MARFEDAVTYVTKRIDDAAANGGSSSTVRTILLFMIMFERPLASLWCWVMLSPCYRFIMNPFFCRKLHSIAIETVPNCI